MKKISTLLLLLIIGTNVNLLSQPWAELIEGDENNFINVQKAFNKFWQDKELVRGEGWKQFKRWEYLWEQRTFPNGIIPNARVIFDSYEQFKSSKGENPLLLSNFSDWKEVGPIKVPQNKLNYKSGGLGRLNVVRIHPTNNNIIWVGSAGGGAWFTTNRGQTWTKAEFTDVLSLGVSDIAIAPSKPDVIYLSTGDKNGFFMTNEYSVGILKSTDAGKSWNFTSEKYNLNDYHLSNRIIVHPTNHNLVYAATNRGILKSTDGAATWSVLNNTAIFRDIEFKPGNPEIIYATTSGMNQGTTTGRIFRSSDAGNTWTIVATLNGSSRIDLAVTPANPDYVYAVASRNTGAFFGLFRSTNSGINWLTQSNSPNILSIDVNGGGNTGQGFYDLAIAVSPANPEFVFVGGIHTWGSSNGGKNWQILNHWTGSHSLPFVHADQHHFVYTKDARELYAANDGGLYFTSNNGTTWNDISDGLAIAQYYKIDVSPASTDLIVGGTQDNGSSLFDGKNWAQVNGGDGMACAIDPENPSLIYTTTQYGNLFRSTNGGNNFSRISGPDIFQGEIANWVSPFVLNPQNPSSIYIGYRNVYKSTNWGNSWIKMTNFTNSAAINHLAVAPSDSMIMYMAVRNYLYKSLNGGTTWTGIFNRQNWISGIAVDPDNADRVFISLSGYSVSDRVFEIIGSQIKNITYNLPNIPANTIVFQHNTAGRIFIGSDIGVYMKSDDFSEEWTLFNTNLPPVVISDLKINYSTGKIYAGTYGRGIWESQLFDCNLEKPLVKVSGQLTFCDGDSVKLEALTSFDNVLWSSGETSKSIVVKRSGNYFVSIKDEVGCTEKSEPVNVEMLNVPAFNIRSNRGMAICGDNDTISIFVPLGLQNYVWSTGDTTSRISVSEPGYYVASAVTESGCPLIDSVYIAKRPVPAKPNIYYEDGILFTDTAFSYRWYRNNSAILGANQLQYIPTESGDYFVVAFDENGCFNSSESISITTSVMVTHNSSDMFLISPNPFENNIRITPNYNFDNIEVGIIDILGRKLVSDFVSNLSSGQDYLINLDNFSIGTYILLIKSNNQIYSFNIQKLN
ncbi:MAG: T9SS type A sorting domain-containing protein [Candidatus Kapabacteria bacterium]|nr:T9SS type A sorting domain-containing protein [Ignavibacteriota bacterium]MCW5883444.1 T9SS type A sorting domain-containing protein [Candidatus Kapabacteria bacterium]